MEEVPQVEVPEYEVSERVELPAESTAFIVVDMQNDFAREGGSLYVPSTREILPRIQALLNQARNKGVLVIFTQDWHQKDDPEFALWPVHCVENTEGAEIVEEIKPLPGEIVIKKLRYDAFYGTSLEHILRWRKITTVVVTGTVANICVLHTAGSAALRWFQVVVPVGAVAPLTEFDLYSTFRQIHFLYRGILVKSEGIIFR
ncbi:MAG: cysteine hydrolase family protein [bacterium JZ-2024 1]